MPRSIMLILMLYSSCLMKNNSNEYEAYWYDTYYKLALNENQTFTYLYEGHRGNSEYQGTYEIVNDTIILKYGTKAYGENRFLRVSPKCLVELETRFSYCIRTNEEWESERIGINYPQIKESNHKEKQDVIELINMALTNPELEKYFKIQDGQLNIQEYYEIKKDQNVDLIYKGRKVKIFSKEEIERNQIEGYLVIDEITIGLNSAMINFQIMPEFSVGTLDFFEKDKGIWKLKKRGAF